jgi:hypothetical protein
VDLKRRSIKYTVRFQASPPVEITHRGFGKRSLNRQHRELGIQQWTSVLSTWRACPSKDKLLLVCAVWRDELSAGVLMEYRRNVEKYKKKNRRSYEMERKDTDRGEKTNSGAFFRERVQP